jgi:outer membrane protein insertion porin family
MQLVAHPVNETIVDGTTYRYHIRTPLPDPAQGRWTPYDEAAVLADFWNLWRTNFLDNLWVEVLDEPYANGVAGKHVVFHIEERARVKIVDFVPVPADDKLKVELSKIDEALLENNIEIRLDSFVDAAAIRRVTGLLRDLYAELGFTDPVITTDLRELPEGPKLVHLTFQIDPGPKVQIAEIQFEGNDAFSDRKLRGQMKDNKQRSRFLWVLPTGGDYKASQFAADVELVNEFYRNEGYARAHVGAPQAEVLETSEDGQRRSIRLRIPVDEGLQYRIGKFEITGDASLRHEVVREQFDIEEGDRFNLKKLRKGFERASELYGTFGFWQWQPIPELTPRGIDPTTGQPIGDEPPPPIMDVTLRMQEGKQYFVNRISFAGNTTTHDAVVRREMRVFEGLVFNAVALKESVRRINQLGYFKPLEGKEGELDVVQAPNTDNQVDIRLKFEEQNRNSISFGAGVSQFDGFFGQLGFQTSNFMGRGETLGISLQKGSQARQYQVSFTEPYLFNRPITVGADVFSRQYVYPFQFTQEATGGNFVFGVPLADYTRFFTGYSYQRVRVFDINPGYLTPDALNRNPFLRDSLLIDQGGSRIVSKVSPSLVYNTVNQPVFPSAGTRYTAAFDFAGLGGNTSFFQTRLEGIWYRPLTTRMSFGLRAEGQYIRPYGGNTSLPIFEKFFLGGEYSVRGFEIRSIGPRDPFTNVVTGGNKSLTFNAEYYINLFGPVRLLGFFDAGQVRDVGQNFAWKEDVIALQRPPLPLLIDPFARRNLLEIPGSITPVVVGTTSAFKTSTGVEFRFMMPMLNVPFRLIGAFNPQRRGVLDANGQPTPRFTFRFAVGTTF